MANYGATQRPHLNSTPPSDHDFDDSTGKQRKEFRFVCPFNIPSTPEAAAIRIIKNLHHFGLYYSLFVWIVLFITLIPKRKVSLIYLVIMTYVTTVYVLLIRALPSASFLHKIIGRGVVLPLIGLGTMVELILTEAGLHLLICLAATMPIVLVHAVLWVRDDVVVGVEVEVEVDGGGGGGGGGEELVAFVQKSDTPGVAGGSESMV
ncbi:hypothetical protein HS088_TW18G00281 [Tripterygium wilfordii]|uniref:PRA1 family protein n=1 Tax=Tripterygium wilfordii TaxID=458696 RepID=A0A7J7CBZ3_TRIWF|nr:PRA1 family protein D-like [Tripterygium wilfordii]KAF5731600.1 hypothetical protein HS088_TW18G00281 [Tripterygium wilfordii]